METIKVLQNMEERFDYALYLNARENENRLSDIVRAMCQSDKEFFKTFFEFCFPNEENIELYGIDREVVHGTNGRNDFNIHTSKGMYIVESKIGDKTINAEKYLDIVEQDSTRITYIVPEKWDGKKDELNKRSINVVIWEEFIKKDYIRELTFFTRKAELILNMEEKNLPPKTSVETEIEIIEEFKEQFFSKDGHLKQESHWTDKTNPFYGYYCWSSVWFGIGYHPLKGVFFCFAISTDGDKIIGKDATNNNLNKLGPFQKSIKLGKYKNDKNHYFEVHEVPINDKEKALNILDKAFREFADKIIVIEGTEKIPLLEYINYTIC